MISWYMIHLITLNNITKNIVYNRTLYRGQPSYQYDRNVLRSAGCVLIIRGLSEAMCLLKNIKTFSLALVLIQKQ